MPSATAIGSMQLRKVFDKFDADGSGAVSTDEMAAMLKTLKIKYPPGKIERLMKEADPDGSGQIEYEEYALVLQKQLKEGGGLADVVTEASTAFGWVRIIIYSTRTERLQ